MKRYRVSRDRVTRIAEFVIIEAESEGEAFDAAERGEGDVETDGGKEETFEPDHATPIDDDGNELPD